MTLKTNKTKPKNKQLGFTIVELLIGIVIIGILAAIVIVSYIGLSKKATEASLTSDLDGAKRQLELYKTEHETYPTTMDENKCPTAPTNDTKYCLKNKSLEYTTIDNGLAYSLKLAKLDITYEVTSDSVPKIAESILPESDWITIGTQRWARKNLNVGTRINGSQAQTNNGGTNVVEKYCYGNSDANCTTNNNGGLYQWDEAMGYGMIEGAQGICPTGSHIPSDNDWKILEVQLGMSQDIANIIGWRGTNEGAKLKAGGSSGLNVPLAGLRNTDGLFYGQLSDANLWSSSYFWSTSVWFRSLLTSQTDVLHNTTNRYTGLSIRCLGN